MPTLHRSVPFFFDHAPLLAAQKAAQDEATKLTDALTGAMKAHGIERVKLLRPVDYIDPCAETPRFSEVALDDSGDLVGIDPDSHDGSPRIADQGVEIIGDVFDALPWKAPKRAGGLPSLKGKRIPIPS